MSEHERKKYPLKWLALSAAIFLIVVLLPLAGLAIFSRRYHQRIYPGLSVGSLSLSGLTQEQAKLELNKRVDTLRGQGIVFHYHNEDATFYPLTATLEGDIAKETIIFDIDNTVMDAYRYGRAGSVPARLYRLAAAWLNPQQLALHASINQEDVYQFLKNNFGHFDTPAQNARLAYTQDKTWSPYIFSVEEETYGQTLDYARALRDLSGRINRLNNAKVELIATLDYPDIYSRDALNVDSQAQTILARAPLMLRDGNDTWKIDKPALADWLLLKRGLDKSDPERIQVGLDREKIIGYLDREIASSVNEDPVNGKFEIKDGKVAEFQASHDGRKLSLAKSSAIIEESLVIRASSTVNLAVDEIKSEVQPENIENFGIDELIGTGHSSFSGSPQNRRHNIAVGAASVNGTLIAPDEEFSLLKVLGDINKETGYLPELVIKEGKTIPEYGGGLCQIGTTMFRGTFESGLPVTMRRNHSYRVSYYEPAGTDATIYDPWPDFKFLNDTGNYILLQSRIDGDDLYFDFWGTKDGRIATHTAPTIYNIAKPGPTKIIETTDLAPGEKKCTEHAHNGADAYFDYTVTYADGKIDETRFKSHYVPWQEVCLVGVETLPTDNKNTASTTSEAAPIQ